MVVMQLQLYSISFYVHIITSLMLFKCLKQYRLLLVCLSVLSSLDIILFSLYFTYCRPIVGTVYTLHLVD